MQESDWDEFLERLVEQTKSAIEQFAAEHSNEEVCYFAFDSEPRYGYVLTCFNTSSSSLKFTHEWHERHRQRRRERMADPIWFNNAYHQAKFHAVLPFCDNTGDFEHQGFTKIEFPEWRAYAESETYPKSDEEDDDYLLNRAARLFCRAIERLVDERIFEQLRLARPTLVGFAFHDHDQQVMHMLNLPELPK